jgi:hypothetical protein
VGHFQLLYVVNIKISHAKRGYQKNPEITHGLPDDCPPPLCMPAFFKFDHLILKANALTGYYNRQQPQPPTTTTANNNNHTTTKPQPYYKDKTTIQNDTTTIRQPTCPKTNTDPQPQPLKKLSEIPAAASARTQAPCSSSSTPHRPASFNNERHSKKSNTTTSAEQQGWISNRSVRDFAGQPGGATTNKPIPTAVTTAPPWRDTPKPAEAKRRPVVSNSSSITTTKPAAAATDAIPSMDDPPSFGY